MKNVLEPSIAEENLNSSQYLNRLINKGFDAKHACEFAKAIGYFSEAIELEPELDLKLMLILDVALMYQELGNYKEAILALENFVENNSNFLTFSVLQDIKIQLQYLSYLKDMLEKIKMPNLPLSRIPMIIKVSVNEKIKDWKKSVNL